MPKKGHLRKAPPSRGDRTDNLTYPWRLRQPSASYHEAKSSYSWPGALLKQFHADDQRHRRPEPWALSDEYFDWFEVCGLNISGPRNQANQGLRRHSPEPLVLLSNPCLTGRRASRGGRA